MNTSTEKLHSLGKKIAAIRKIKGLSQQALADRLDTTRQKISSYESAEDLKEEQLLAVANALGISTDAIRNFNEEASINNVGNEFHEGSNLINYNFNPIEKIMELTDKLLKTEREKYELLQGIVELKNDQINLLQQLLAEVKDKTGE